MAGEAPKHAEHVEHVTAPTWREAGEGEARSRTGPNWGSSGGLVPPYLPLVLAWV